MKKVILYTDGACSGNPGSGGWAAILIYKDIRKKFTGAKAQTTNNEMELTAVIEGLKALNYPCEVEIYSDSQYVVNAFQKGWLKKWVNNDWTTSLKEPVKNQELWEQLLTLSQYHKIKLNKVKGHEDNMLNNECDKLARQAIKDLLSAESNNQI